MITYMKSTKSAKSKEEIWKSVSDNWDAETKSFAAELSSAFEVQAFKQKLADSIRERRAKLGLSQRDLAQALGISQREICHLEKAKSNPTLSTQLKILSALGLSLEIIGISESKKSKRAALSD